jgi:hypothetical protein
MTIAWTVLLPLVKTPNPADVKPGWLAFGVVLILMAAVAFLGFSLVKHLGRVNFEEKEIPHDSSAQSPGSRDDFRP